VARAKVINVEFNYTPFVGDFTVGKPVKTVPGKVVVFINNVPHSTQEVVARDVPVTSDGVVGSAVRIPGDSMGPSLRRGKNRIRVEFVPAIPKAAYLVQFRTTTVHDGTAELIGADALKATTKTEERIENEDMVGKGVSQQAFVADFSVEKPWHSLPAITELTDADKAALAALVTARAQAFKPDFTAVLQMLKVAAAHDAKVDVAQVRKARHLPKAHAAGVRVEAPAAETLQFILTGNAEVVVTNAAHNLFPLDPKAIKRLKGAEARTLGVLYPPHLVAVRDTSGTWAWVN